MGSEAENRKSDNGDWGREAAPASAVGKGGVVLVLLAISKGPGSQWIGS